MVLDGRYEERVVSLGDHAYIGHDAGFGLLHLDHLADSVGL